MVNSKSFFTKTKKPLKIKDISLSYSNFDTDAVLSFGYITVFQCGIRYK